MQRQVVKPQTIDSNLLKYLTKADRVWFTLPENQFHDRIAFDYNSITSQHGLNVGFRTIFAIKKSDETEIRKCLAELAADPSSPITSEKISSFQADQGTVIPYGMLGEYWTHNGEISKAELLELAIRVALRIEHVTDSNVHGSDNPLVVWETGYGQCFDRASIMVAAYRRNGVPARVVGRNDFFEGEDGGHWWAEANIGGEWISFDSTYNTDLIRVVLEHAAIDGVSRRDLPMFLLESLEGFTRSGIAVSQITSKAHLNRVKERVVAAESDLP
ncbi:MAG: transglutaminase-like domain-containing protein [Candidatus Micrarchaeota archaeon]|nr:transglutaminase-like domain-containing protein [Candidatus Micrarchaeota archaeon]